MKASQSDELPHITQLADVLLEGGDLRISHASSIPVEAGRQVVAEKNLVTMNLLNSTGKIETLRVDGFLRLHPENVAVRRECNSTANAHPSAALDAIIAFPGTREIPAPEGNRTEQPLSLSTHLVSTREHIDRLVAARLMTDVLGVETIIVARTDAEAATLLDTNIDPRDHSFIVGASNPNVNAIPRLMHILVPHLMR
mmetsp:Transcript_4582/g.4476  ORF Transcript_4582/g.4476 Transcript_4582/m.4476 type:complete len:198 (-) Transcript_4582:144-737(-)